MSTTLRTSGSSIQLNHWLNDAEQLKDDDGIRLTIKNQAVREAGGDLEPGQEGRWVIDGTAYSNANIEHLGNGEFEVTYSEAVEDADAGDDVSTVDSPDNQTEIQTTSDDDSEDIQALVAALSNQQQQTTQQTPTSSDSGDDAPSLMLIAGGGVVLLALLWVAARRI